MNNKGLIALFLLAVSTASNAGVVTYTDRAAWEAAVAGMGTMTTEDFDAVDVGLLAAGTNVVGKLKVTLNSIEKSGTSGWPLTGVYDTGSFDIFTGNYLQVDIDDYPHVLTASVDFGPNTFAFGFDFIEKIAYDDTEILVGGENFVVSEILSGGHRGFVGFVSDDPLASALFHDPFISGARFGVDNFSIVATASRVTEPPTMVLLGAVFIGLLMRLRASRG